MYFEGCTYFPCDNPLWLETVRFNINSNNYYNIFMAIITFTTMLPNFNSHLQLAQSLFTLFLLLPQEKTVLLPCNSVQDTFSQRW